MLNTAIVGLGWWGRRIVEAVQGRSQHIRFTHAVSLEYDESLSFAQQHQLSLSTSLEDMLQDSTIHAVVLATPHSLHVSQVVAAAKAGKHVLCEKPLAMNQKDALKAIQACQEHGVQLGIGNNRRYYPSMKALRAMTQTNQLGKILHIEGSFSNANSKAKYAPWRADTKETPGGPLTATGVHMLDAVVSLAGPISWIHANWVSQQTAPDPLDVLAAFMQHNNGITSNITTVRASPMFWRFQVYGTKASAEARGEDQLFVHQLDGSTQIQTFDKTDAILNNNDAFARAITMGEPYPITPEEIFQVVASFEATLLSLSENRVVHHSTNSYDL
ncbi:MAG: Gfo/Idh/MocA family oxidoreductase [Betaproteobacteria bacterium]|nr:gfo/Idh/MocA family oxidoreductase [Betaproteobacteria bacterium]NBT69590.1 gfo/Idh/MocA family oxidoreductase [Betaproteobacteria bacterium]